MRTFLALSLALLLPLAAACTREKEGQVAADGEGGPGRPLPRITYAEIVSTNLTAEGPLTVQYAAQEGASDLVIIRWYVDGAVVGEAAGNMLEPQHFKKGSTVAAEIVPTDGTRSAAPFRTAAVTVRNSPPAMTSAVLRPVPAFAGDTLTAVAEATDRDGDSIQFEYKWLVNGNAAPGGENGSFPTAGLKKKDTIAALVTPSDGELRGKALTTDYTVLSNRAPNITSSPPSGSQNGVYVYQVKANDPDGDQVAYSLASGPSGMTIDRSTGLLRWQPPAATGRQEMSVKIAVEDAEGGVSYQEFSMNLDLR